MKVIFSVLVFVAGWFGVCQAQVKILFDATKAESAVNADWVIDADQHNLDWNPNASTTGGNESNAQRVPTPAQSGITASTPETYWTGALSAWGVDCVKQGYYVESLPYTGRITYNDTTNAQDLSNYKVFVIDEPNIRFTTTEQTAILQFIQNGGGLFMISDHDVSDRNNDGWDSPNIWNDLMSNNGNPFGITFDLLNISPNPTGIAVPANDSIRNGPYGGVTEVLYSNGTSMTLDPTANATVKGEIYTTATGTGNSNVLFAIAHYGLGKVAALGDSSPPDDGTGDPNDNLFNGWTQDANGNHEKLIMNATIWLASTATIVPPPTILISGNTNTCHGQPTTLTATGATTYTWQPGGQTTSSITVSPTHTTTYYVTGTTSGASATDSITVAVGQLPMAGFSASVSNNTVTVTNTSTGQTSCTWSWGDGNTATGCNPAPYTYGTSGTYTIKLKVTNSCGSDSVTHNITIAPATINLQVGGNTNICNGQPTTLTASGATTYTWQPGGQTTSSITVSPTHTTTYYVTGTTSGASATDSITVAVGQLPMAGFSASVSNNTVTVTNTSTGQTSCTWSWGDGNTATGCNPAPYTYGTSGTYTIKLKVTNSCGSDSVTHNITIAPATINLQVGGNTNICNGQPTTLTASGATTYTWQPGGQTTANITVSPTHTTTYYVTGTTSGASATDSITVAVGQLPMAGFSASVSNNTVTVTNTSTGQTSCTWYWGDGSTYSGCNPPPQNFLSGTDTIMLVATNTCGTDTFTAIVTISPPLPNVHIQGKATICAGQNDTLSVTGADTYLWQPNNQSGNTLEISPTATTTYYVTGTNASGSATDSITVVIDSLPLAVFMDSVSGDTVMVTNLSQADTACIWSWGDGTLYTGCNPPPHVYDTGHYYIELLTSGYCGNNSIQHEVYIGPVHTGIANVDAGNVIKVFPVPTDDMLNIQLPQNDWQGNMEIMDLSGRVLRNLKVQGPLSKIPVAGLPPGLYFGKVLTEKTSYSFRFVKQ